MARIPDEEIKQAKQIPLSTVAVVYGVELHRHGSGGDLAGRCPFHSPDETPSLVITPHKNLFRCFGCGAAGSVVDFVMKIERVEFVAAVEILHTRFAGAATCAPQDISTAQPPAPSPSSRYRPDLSDCELLGQVARYYHDTLLDQPQAQDYLRGRGIDDPRAWKHFELGYANRTLGPRLPARSRSRDNDLRGRYRKLGIMRANGREHLNGSVVVPIRDEHGEVVQMYGRKTGRALRSGTARHLYLPLPLGGVWNLEALKASREVILCEALLDALTFWSAGFRNVTSSYGVEGFTEDHLAAFQRYGTERVLIAYDRDEAGEKAAAKLAARLHEHGLACFRVEFPHHMDANEYALKVQPASNSLALLLRSARFLGRGEPPVITSVPETISVEIAEHTGNDEEKTLAEPVPSLVAEPPLPAAKEAAQPDGPPTTPNRQSTEPTSTFAEAATVDKTIPVQKSASGIVITLGDRRYRIRGLAKNTTYERLFVNVRVTRGPGDDLFHQDNVDLTDATKRSRFIKQAAEELGCEPEVIKRDLGKLLRKLEELQDELIQQTLAPKETAVELSAAEQAAATDLLTSPDLLTRIAEDFRRAGVVGERVNLTVAYLAAVSRLLERPLGVLIQSSSAAGKTTLMDAVLGFLPEEAKVKYSAMTGQSLFYMGNLDLRHKVLAIAEEEGASRATYALKLLQSEGELTIASTGKDPQSGKLVTHEYRVEGPVTLISTTTAVEVDEELANRCITLAVDESREQTRRIHQQQRFERTLDGIAERQQRPEIRKLHQNAQRLLKPVLVYNPFATELGFTDEQTRTRRDNAKYLALMDAIALLHQHQRPHRTVTLPNGNPLECVVVTRDDVLLANQLANEVLGRLLDELSPQSRNLLVQIHAMVAEETTRLGMEPADYRFSRRQVREHTGWSDFQVKMHMKKLEELEYVLVHQGRRGQSFVYELIWDGQGQGGQRFVMGLIDPAGLQGCGPGRQSLGEGGYDENKEHPRADKEHPETKKEPSSSIQVAPKEHPSSIGQNGPKPLQDKARSDFEPENGENAYIGARNGAPSRRSRNRTRTTTPALALRQCSGHALAACEDDEDR